MDPLLEIFSYQFFIYAIIAAVLSSIICGIIGSYIVSKRMVFLSGGITHASFGGIGIGYYMGLNPVAGAAIFAVLSALGIEYFSKKSQIRQDSAIGIGWSFGMAIGIIFIFLTPGYTPNLMTYLFGSILTISAMDLIFMAIVAIILIVFFSIYYYPILFISFDEEYAKTHKIPVAPFNYVLISLVALSIVMNIRTVGVILVISLLTIPQTTANLFTNQLNKMIIYSIIFALTGSFSGLFISYFLNVPSGASIIFSLVIIFAVLKLFTFIHVMSKRKTGISNSSAHNKT